MNFSSAPSSLASKSPKVSLCASLQSLRPSLHQSPIQSLRLDGAQQCESLYRPDPRLTMLVWSLGYEYFKEVMGKSLGFILKHIEAHMATCFDAMGILLCVRINIHYRVSPLIGCLLASIADYTPPCTMLQSFACMHM